MSDLRPTGPISYRSKVVNDFISAADGVVNKIDDALEFMRDYMDKMVFKPEYGGHGEPSPDTTPEPTTPDEGYTGEEEADQSAYSRRMEGGLKILSPYLQNLEEIEKKAVEEYEKENEKVPLEVALARKAEENQKKIDQTYQENGDGSGGSPPDTTPAPTTPSPGPAPEPGPESGYSPEVVEFTQGVADRLKRDYGVSVEVTDEDLKKLQEAFEQNEGKIPLTEAMEYVSEKNQEAISQLLEKYGPGEIGEGEREEGDKPVFPMLPGDAYNQALQAGYKPGAELETGQPEEKEPTKPEPGESTPVDHDAEMAESYKAFYKEEAEKAEKTLQEASYNAGLQEITERSYREFHEQETEKENKMVDEAYEGLMRAFGGQKKEVEGKEEVDERVSKDYENEKIDNEMRAAMGGTGLLMGAEQYQRELKQGIERLNRMLDAQRTGEFLEENFGGFSDSKKSDYLEDVLGGEKRDEGATLNKETTREENIQSGWNMTGGGERSVSEEYQREEEITDAIESMRRLNEKIIEYVKKPLEEARKENKEQ